MEKSNQQNNAKTQKYEPYFVINNQQLTDEDQDQSNVYTPNITSAIFPSQFKRQKIDDFEEFLKAVVTIKVFKNIRQFSEKYHSFLRFLDKAQRKEKNKEQQRKFIYNLIKKFLEQKFERSFYSNSFINKNIVDTRCKKIKRYQNSLELVHQNSRKNILEKMLKLKVSEKKFNLQVIYDLLKCPQTNIIIEEFLRSKQSTNMFLSLKKQKVKQSFDTYECQILKIKKANMNEEEYLKQTLLNTRKFSKLPWSYKNFKEAKESFLNCFFAKKNDPNNQYFQFIPNQFILFFIVLVQFNFLNYQLQS